MTETQISDLRVAAPQVIAVFVKNILLLAYGMTIGYPTILIPGLSKSDTNNDIYLDQEGLSWIGSLNFMCVPIGCFFSGLITQPLGRKRTMQIVSIPFTISWIIFRFASESWHVYFALGLTGLSGGLLEAPVLTYVAEVTQPHMRGLLSATSTMFIYLGVLVEFFMGAFLDWRTLAQYSAISPAIAFICLFFIPESPHWLFMKNRHDDARRSLAWLRGWTTVSAIEEEFQEMSLVRHTQHQIELYQPTDKRNIIKQYFSRRFLHPLVFVSFVFFISHFSGITTLQTYAVAIFSTLQVPMDKYYATVLLGISQFLGCLTCVTLVHFTGKRALNFFTMILAAICLTATATYAYFIDAKFLISNNAVEEKGSYKWFPLVCLVFATFMLTSGIRSLPWILTGEVFSRNSRAFGAGVLAAIGYIFGFVANKIFLQTVSAITLPGALWSSAGFIIVGVLILFFWLPETEGKTLLEITEHYAGKGQLDNKVRRKQAKSKENGCVNEAFETKSLDVIVNGSSGSKL